jgi:hypothetical protein
VLAKTLGQRDRDLGADDDLILGHGLLLLNGFTQISVEKGVVSSPAPRECLTAAAL